VDFPDKDLPPAVRDFMPDRNGDSYLCILGSEPDRLMIGTGTTVMRAPEDGDRSYHAIYP